MLQTFSQRPSEGGSWCGRPIGVNFSTAVILSTAKDLRSAQREILSVAKDDRGRAWQADAS